MPPGMSSLGASTAVFAALGLVTAKGRTPHHGHRWFREFYAALIAGVLLLALLGTGDAHTDILGHALGFATGLMFGLPLRDAPFVSQWKDRLWGAVAILACTGAWALALTHSESFR